MEAMSAEALRPKKLCVRAQEGMRAFTLYRQSDESGVSGTGTVLEGVIFSCGKCVIHWLTPAPDGSLAVFDDFNQFIRIHVSSHLTNRSIVTYDDGEQETYG